MDPTFRAFLVGVILGIGIAVLTYLLGGTGEYFYVRIAGVIVGFVIITVIIAVW